MGGGCSHVCPSKVQCEYRSSLVLADLVQSSISSAAGSNRSGKVGCLCVWHGGISSGKRKKAVCSVHTGSGRSLERQAVGKDRKEKRQEKEAGRQAAGVNAERIWSAAKVAGNCLNGSASRSVKEVVGGGGFGGKGRCEPKAGTSPPRTM